MIQTFLITAFVILLVMFVWIGVQFLWKRTFSEFVADEDVMAGRTSCRNCNCMGVCALKNTEEESEHKIPEPQL